MIVPSLHGSPKQTTVVGAFSCAGAKHGSRMVFCDRQRYTPDSGTAMDVAKHEPAPPGSAEAVSVPCSSSGANSFMTVCVTGAADEADPDGPSTAGAAPPVPDADVNGVRE